jgi:hypothetical protein
LALTTEDRLQVAELFSRYAWSLDTANLEAYVGNFTPDAIVEMTAGRFTGHDAIRAYGAGLFANPGWKGRQHFVSQLIVEDTGESARCRVRAYGMIVHRDPDGSCRMMALGTYRDICVKFDGRWLFAERIWRQGPPEDTN